MDVTVGICTWNRAESLRDTLRAFAEITIPSGLNWELVVVANRCTDHTTDVVSSFQDRLPVRYIEEPQPGKSHALNRAVAESRGRWILWTDDDVIPDRDWIRCYAAAVHRHPDAGFLFGEIRPHFVSERPDWLKRNWARFASAYAILDHGPTEFRVGRRHLPFGANWAVRSDLQRSFPYDPRLGPLGRSGVVGEESLVCRQLVEAGHQGWWIPGAGVQHVLGPDRLNLHYLERYHVGIGMTAEIVEQMDRESPATMTRRRRWAIRWRWLSATVQSQIFASVRWQSRAIQKRMRARYHRGRLQAPIELAQRLITAAESPVHSSGTAAPSTDGLDDRRVA